MNNIVYFKMCKSENKYNSENIFDWIINKIHHYKFIIMSKLNVIEKKEEDNKTIYTIYYKEENTKKILRKINWKINKIINEKKNEKIILSKQIKRLIKSNKNIHNIERLNSILQNSMENKKMYESFFYEIIRSVIKIRNEIPEEQSIYILLNSNMNRNLLNKIIPNFKMTNIVTYNPDKFRILEQSAEDNQEPVCVLNNKRKSIAKAKYIINIDFKYEEIQVYSINRTAVIFNISNEKIQSLNNFDGIIINNINIDKNESDFDLKDEYMENKFYEEEILKDIENCRYELEGNNGKIEFKELSQNYLI